MFSLFKITPLLPKTTFTVTGNGGFNETCQRRAKYFAVTDHAHDVFFLVIGRIIIIALSLFGLLLEVCRFKYLIRESKNPTVKYFSVTD